MIFFLSSFIHLCEECYIIKSFVNMYTPVWSLMVVNIHTPNINIHTPGWSLLVVNIHTPNINIHTPVWSLLVVNIYTPNISIHTPGWRVDAIYSRQNSIKWGVLAHILSTIHTPGWRVWPWQAARLTRPSHARRRYSVGSTESRNWSRAAPKTACRCSESRTWIHTEKYIFQSC